jgi:hypothetical protein
MVNELQQKKVTIINLKKPSERESLRFRQGSTQMIISWRQHA